MAAPRSGWTMMRAALLAIMVACAATQTVAAEDYHREELRIPMSAAGPRGLEAFLIRPSGARACPPALRSHGAPVDPKDRRLGSRSWLYRQAVEFARRGFAALVV